MFGWLVSNMEPLICWMAEAGLPMFKPTLN